MVFMLSDVMISVAFYHLYAECHYAYSYYSYAKDCDAECHYAYPEYRYAKDC